MKALAHHVSSLAVPFVLAASIATAQTIRPVSGSLQRIWFVDEAATFGGSGTRSAPFRTIQEGIDAARDGDRVLVAPGVYVERIDFLGKAIAVVASEGPAVTSIGKKFPVGTAVGVVFQNGEGPDSVIDGFTIEDYIGFESAVLCIGASPTIVRNVIRDNSSVAILCNGCDDIRILSNEIRSNDASSLEGAGITAWNSTVRIAGNTIVENSTDFLPAEGAGIHLFRCAATIENNLIAGNSCVHRGGGNRGAGLYADQSSVVSRGDTFTANLAAIGYSGEPGEGGAIACEDSDLSISGSILWANVAASGPSIWEINSSVYVAYSDVQGGVAKVVTIGGALDWGPGNLDTAPLFINAANDDYRLKLDSPLLDQGPPSQTAGGIDAGGNPRLLDGDLDGVERVDMGALEHNSARLSVSGGAALRGTVTFTTTAPSGWSYTLFVGARAGDTPAPPFGSFLLASGLKAVGSGTVPHDDVLAMPPSIALVGQELWGQSLALKPGGAVGNLSNAVRVVVH